jgi:hypothetical protein
MSEELTVRAGTALARDEKRSAPNIIDVVSADAMGRFPTRMPRKRSGGFLASRSRSIKVRAASS